jgi:hypothetical protein
MLAANRGLLGMQADVLKGIVTVGGVFLSSIGAFPLKEVLTHRDRLRILRLLSSKADDDNTRAVTIYEELRQVMLRRL